MIDSIKIYRAPVIKAIHDFYGELLFPKAEDTIHSHLERLVSKMYEGTIKKVHCIYTQFNNNNPEFIGMSAEKLSTKTITLQDCRHTVANEYSFGSWENVIKLATTKYNLEFEKCVNAVVSGDLDGLRSLIKLDPSLINHQSQYGHKATLLHYTSSNGVELWRQQVPENLVEVVKYLINAGADKKRKMKVYGGEFTAHELYTSSAHPYEAGLGNSVVDLLI